MSISKRFDRFPNNWWDHLGLYTDTDSNATELQSSDQQRVVAGLLKSIVPVVFEDRSGPEPFPQLSLEELKNRVTRAKQEATLTEAKNIEQLRNQGWQKITEALTHPDAGQEITTGKWQGFLFGDAVAWCWNLFDFEPQGFTHPRSELRARAMRLLLDGGVPEVFGHSVRAKELIESGFDPISYRKAQESLGKRIFRPEDVVHR